MEARYWPIDKRRPDTQYKDALRLIRETGEYTKSRFQTHGTWTSLSVPAMHFYFHNGFPILMERNITFWRRPINELFAFINGVRDAQVLDEEWGVKWWREHWATPEKCAQFGLEPYDLGPGSYGAAFHDFPTGDGGTFNQFEHLIKQIRKYPEIRTHKITSWIPQYCLHNEDLERKVVVAPCHGDIQITVINRKLTLRMDQRSADFPIGVPSNMVQYAALTIAIAHLTDLEPERFIHATHDSQIYEGHLEDVDKILDREVGPFPSMHLTEEGKKITSIFNFRSHHFELRDYNPQPAMRLADAVV